MVAFLDARLEALRRRDRKADLDLAVLELAHDVEARPGEDAQHGSVLREHLRDEASHAAAGGAVGQLLEQARADPAALLFVGDHERDLCGRGVTQPHVVRDADNPVAEPAG